VHRLLEDPDLALIHALQIAPRVSWAQAGQVLGASPAALAERWARLRGSGLAWVTAHVNASRPDLIVAFVEVDCLPEARPDVVRHLCQDPRAVTVEEAARGRDLQVTVMVRDLRALTRFVLEDLPRVPGVRQTRSRLATGLHFEASRWRLDVLEPAQVRSLAAVAGQHRGEPGGTPPRDPGPLMEALAVDGRLAASDLARRTGRNAATVRRQLPRLLASGRLTFRCEVAQFDAGYPVSCNWLARVPVEEHARTVQALATLPELRLCVSTTGETNIMLTAWTRSLAHLLSLERLMGERLPWLSIVDSSVTLRVAKRMGWLLDDEGRCTGEVVVNRLES
jgi:DNA-binding Lrp family transcriptional regulator